MNGKNGTKIVNDARVTRAFASDVMDIGTLWELCVCAEFGREALPPALSEWIGEPGAFDVLDCACGSGFPAIDLDLLGHSVTASDGSEIMLRHCADNAALMGSSLRAQHVYWENLVPHYGEESFDVVMCRGGGNYLYGDTWDADGEPRPERLAPVFEQFFRCCRPGGRLYIDITKKDRLDDPAPEVVDHPTYLIGGKSVRFHETVSLLEDTGQRRWQSRLSVDGTVLEQDRHSHLLRHEDFVAMLADAGFVGIAPITIEGEAYDVFEAQRPR